MLEPVQSPVRVDYSVDNTVSMQTNYPPQLGAVRHR